MRENPCLYEINTVAWLYELSRKYGKPFTVGNIPAPEWDRIRELGFDFVWLMGVWKRSRTGKEIFRNDPVYHSFVGTLPDFEEADFTGSPYSIAAYEPDPLIGSWEDIDRVREVLNERHMGLILDFIPNHTAHDHPWVSLHPEYYIQGSENDFNRDPQAFARFEKEGLPLFIAKGRDPFFPPWHDTLQLNYFNAGAHCALVGELRKISKHCDGVRCDMAMLVLDEIFHRTWGWSKKYNHNVPAKYEFWTEVRYAVPKFILMAEAYWETEWTLQQLGFDFVYDKRLYDRMISSSPQDLCMHLEADITFQKKLVRFLENHDEYRSAALFGRERLMSRAVLFSTVPGMKLYHQGQLEGRRIKLPVQFRRTAPENPDPDIEALYHKILSIISQEVFHSGQWQFLEVMFDGDDTFRNFVAYLWKSDGTVKLVAVNLGRDVSRGRISLKDIVDREKQYVLFDELNDREYVRSGGAMTDPGLHIVLEGYRAHIFDFRTQ
jgi:glycosidase